MERCRQYILMAIVVALLLFVGCKREEMVDLNKPGNNISELRFRPSLAEANNASRASESDNDVLQTASAAGDNPPHIAIETYTGTPGISLEKYFTDELGYFASSY